MVGNICQRRQVFHCLVCFAMNTILILILIAASLVAIGPCQGLECTADTCSMVRCKNVSRRQCRRRKNRIFVKNGGFCGCCNACRVLIREYPFFCKFYCNFAITGKGQSCPPPLSGVPPTSQCVRGSQCVNGTCQAIGNSG